MINDQAHEFKPHDERMLTFPRGTRVTPSSLEKLYPPTVYTVVKSRELARSLLNYLKQAKPDEYKRLCDWADATPTVIAGDTNHEDKVFLALCQQASLTIGMTPTNVVEEIKAKGTCRGILLPVKAVNY